MNMKKICSWVVVFMFFVIPVLAFAQPIPGSDDDLSRKHFGTPLWED
jgi:hypothetical protein